MHDAAGVSSVHCRAGMQPCIRLPVGISRRRPGRAFYPALYRPDCLDVDATVRAARENADLVKGIKAHAELGGFARWGIEVMQLAARIGKEADLPVYIHFGQLWQLPETGANGVDADDILPQVVELLKPGDVLAHPFTRHPGGFVDKNGRVHPIVSEALARGLWVDVGHGSHFSFKMARIALDAGIVPHTLGADMHGYNTHVPKTSRHARRASGRRAHVLRRCALQPCPP